MTATANPFKLRDCNNDSLERKNAMAGLDSDELRAIEELLDGQVRATAALAEVIIAIAGLDRVKIIADLHLRLRAPLLTGNRGRPLDTLVRLLK